MEQMEQKMGIENGYGLSVTKLDVASNISMTPANQKRKVGRPITSVKTMNRFAIFYSISIGQF